MAKVLIEESTLRRIADAIRLKKGKDNLLDPALYDAEILEFNGIDTNAATATAADILEGVTAFAGNEKITGTMPVYDYSNSENADLDIDQYLTGTATEIINHRINKLRTYAIFGSSVTKVDVPNIEKISGYGIMSTSITELHLPNTKIVENNGIYQNLYCTKMRFDNATHFGSGAIRGSARLTTLIMTNPNKVCAVTSSNVFAECYHLNGTVHATYNPDGLKDGLIYVPDHLVEDYKVATNWAVFADQIRPLSELKEE